MNIFKNSAKEYLQKNLSVIPDKYGSKQPAIKGWSDYCDRLPTSQEVSQWETIENTNIAICLGPASKVVALDIDTVDENILNEILPILPASPIEKKGSKGFTRFFRYTGETSEILKFNGEVVLEILSTGKKTTLPPSLHPNGSNYVWTSEKTLLDYDLSKLPILPPLLISHLEFKLKTKFQDATSEKYGKVVSGRNDALSQYLGTLLDKSHTVDDVLKKLIEFDKENHEVPLFTDPEEMRHTDAASNALLFYSNHLNSINYRRFRDSKEYLSPVMQAVVDIDLLKESAAKKSQRQVEQKKSLIESLPVNSVVKTLVDNILSNSWVPQPEMALGAVIALYATLGSRKFQFQGISPNVYILNVSLSGSGKNKGLEFIKETLLEIGAQRLLVAGDIGSDAGITDNLSHKPQCIYLMDEMGGILKSINKSGGEYTSKIADILAELYTCSTSAFLGRTLAEGVKGACDRPNVNILGATTPTGFREGVTKASIEKGLMGRFLIFEGNPYTQAKRVKKETPLPDSILNNLSWLYGYSALDEDTKIIGQRPQAYTELKSDLAADKRLDEIFKEFDELRIENINSPASPVIARLYQQMIKLVIIHALANTNRCVPTINLNDVEFGYIVIKHYFESIENIIKNNIFDSKLEKDRNDIYTLIKNEGVIDRFKIIEASPSMSSKYRDSLIDDLLEMDKIFRAVETIENGTKIIYGVKQ